MRYSVDATAVTALVTEVASCLDDATTAAAQVLTAADDAVGIETRIVSDPTPTVFGRGGPVNAISFGTAPGYTISLGGVRVPGDPLDYHDDTLTPAPSS
ncbi:MULTISPECIES: hypothetical protein [Microbacterium]|jgi:hypothetical protein|uniref:hypothetical protein n=1 Tax=Microbacterium TaxID=33882 RepID=UPI001D17B7B6|nr:hypothetical protein [Microbacterium testaceum]MCC4247878.1 hypothetical protein [Microbacterium testaceum]